MLYSNHVHNTPHYLRAHLGLLPIISITSPLCPPVWLNLELEVFGTVGLDDDQRKVLERAIDLLLLLGIVLVSVPVDVPKAYRFSGDALAPFFWLPVGLVQRRPRSRSGEASP